MPVVRITGQKFGREVRSLQVEPSGIRNVIRFRFRTAFCANAREVPYIQSSVQRRSENAEPRLTAGNSGGGFSEAPHWQRWLLAQAFVFVGKYSMKIRKAVITAAGDLHARLPLQSIVDRRGEIRTALRLTLDEIVSSGIDDIAIVIRPGQQDPYIKAAGPHAARLTFFEQTNPRGYGDAILRTSGFIGQESFLHLVSDHLYLSRSDQHCAQQLIDVATRHGCSVSAIQATRENEIVHFGTVGGTPVAQESHLYEVSSVIEKPTPTIAEQKLIVAGQRAGYYLCMFGMHVLTPSVFSILQQLLDAAPPEQGIDLSSSLNRLAQTQRYLAFAVNGTRYNISEKYGLFIAQLAFSLSGVDRDQILTELVHLLSTR